mmetsp:Transcript_17226/g.32607  ORF Transcript_17226/g.32607 Transcript_17226/m.32607 type:complete len:884 (-) Transcript_17226:131-2782(-)|eukprot:CAMPEP_0176482736 /NCGR_PEP_ID=MMETSP0200_2-20121128/3536_1 /TAXON_ID=947934 /ORGANISM="Chaetoceros sp., Strain GSL56" /LENGTH=883 /DNA_ID=CAMNT_0017879075 /DNA_START=122 /DNA_END=2773 /DNA_ORIENTATION=-
MKNNDTFVDEKATELERLVVAVAGANDNHNDGTQHRKKYSLRHYGAMNISVVDEEESLSTSNVDNRNNNIPDLVSRSNESTLTTTTTTAIDDAYRHDYSNRYLIANLFARKESALKAHLYPKTIPTKPPEKRGKRHRAAYFRRMNDFRHWWKTSRLLVRIAGSLCFAFVYYNWSDILPILVAQKHKGIKAAVKVEKVIGQGGKNRPFLKGVQPFTRTMRLYMAINRGIEASVDNRFWDVLIAEALAFMGNRSLRWWARHVVDWCCKYIVFPITMMYLDNGQGRTTIMVWQTIIVGMGLVRAILPFASSFVGSRIGRQSTFSALDRMNFRWKTVQEVKDFVLIAGTYRNTNDDLFCLEYAKKIAAAIGHGSDPLLVRRNLGVIGFELFGTGYGGYSLYRAKLLRNNGIMLMLHITPYGPSIANEMPRYMILERKKMDDITSFHSKGFCTVARMKTDAIVKGFAYSGAFFTFQEWAALKLRYDREKLNYDTACRFMGYKSNSVFAVSNFTPPTDLVSLKGFIRTGRFPNKKKRDNARWGQVMKELDHLSRKLTSMERKGIAPRGVIIYFEGLDCAGKSSTGGLIMKALEQAGYDIAQVQYNKPPTEEEKLRPWMWRFKQPATVIKGKVHKSALVWDRGPAGDFVYGKLSELSTKQKLERYLEFHQFEEECLSNGIMFCKLMFVTSRDSISTTLGKRLAHKEIVRDLHAWLDANSIHHVRDGLSEIENHIDPTDFVAVNKYEHNLKTFHDFVLHTDHVGRSHDAHNSECAYIPWLIINTSKRHLARIQIMKSFEKQLDLYAKSIRKHHGVPPKISEGSLSKEEEADEFHNLLSDPRGPFNHGCPENTGSAWVAVKESSIYVMLMVLIAMSYFHQSWNVKFWRGDYD